MSLLPFPVSIACASPKQTSREARFAETLQPGNPLPLAQMLSPGIPLQKTTVRWPKVIEFPPRISLALPSPPYFEELLRLHNLQAMRVNCDTLRGVLRPRRLAESVAPLVCCVL